MSLLSRIAYRLNGYKGTIRFAKSGLSRPPPEIVTTETEIRIAKVVIALNSLETSINADYEAYKWRMQNAPLKNSTGK